MNVRKATLNDVDNNLASIFIKGFRFHLNGRPDIFDSNKSDEELKNELINTIQNDNNVLIVEESGNVQGFIIFQIKNKHDKTMWIDQLVVDNDFRGKGIAKLLISKVTDIAIEEKCKRIELCCWKFNSNANEMYKHLGFDEQRTIFERKIS